MITIELKDQILSALCCSNIPYECHCSIYKSSFSEDISEPYTEDELVAVLSQFQRLGLISGFADNSRTVELELLAEASDFFSHGGFKAQELLLRSNIEKLGLEIESLSKQLSPDLLDKANKLSGIASAILSALALFKS